jgi:hypothetical protein
MNERQVFDDRRGCYIERSVAETRAWNLGAQAIAWLKSGQQWWAKEFARDAAHYAILSLSASGRS